MEINKIEQIQKELQIAIDKGFESGISDKSISDLINDVDNGK